MTHPLATAIHQAAHEAADRMRRRFRGQVIDIDPFVIELFESHTQISAEEDLELSQLVTFYHAQWGIEVGDTVTIEGMDDQWIVTDVVSDKRTSTENWSFRPRGVAGGDLDGEYPDPEVRTILGGQTPAVAEDLEAHERAVTGVHGIPAMTRGQGLLWDGSAWTAETLVTSSDARLGPVRPNWIVPTFSSGWSEFDRSLYPVSVSKDSRGWVTWRGMLIKTTADPTNGEQILTIPAGYRPGIIERYAVHVSDTVNACLIPQPDGRFVVTSSAFAGTRGYWFALGVVQYWAEN